MGIQINEGERQDNTSSLWYSAGEQIGYMGTQPKYLLINCFSFHNASKILASRVSITV